MSEPRRGVGRSRCTLGPIAAALVGSSGLVVLGAVGAAGSSDSSVETACTGTLNGSTFTLTADCDTTAQLTVPDGVTVDGNGHTITAHDPPNGNFSGAVLTNDPSGSSMHIEDLTIRGTGFAVACLGQQLIGIFFNNASGSVSDVQVEDITQHSGCQLGLGIRANAVAGTARTVTITNTVVSGYQKGALVASGMMTMNVSASTLGPPDRTMPTALPSQNGVQYGGSGSNAGAGGTITGSVIYGSGFGSASDQGTAALLFGASGVTMAQDTITGEGTDVGVDVAADSTGVTVNGNDIGRTAPDVPDSLGIGVSVESGSSAAVTCNSFSGWVSDLSGVPPQPPCITTTELPPAELNTPYTATLEAVGGTPPYIWSIASGSLPSGLSLSSDGTISGTPTATGTFIFSLELVDSLGASARVTQSLEVTVETDVAGYWLGAADGGVFAFGSATFQGSAADLHPVAPVVGMAASPMGGYWLVGSDGGVFSFGAPFFGSVAGRALGAPIVGMAATSEGDGYYLVGADGSVFPFGAAVFRGSMQGDPLNAPIVGIAATADNQGYYLVAADGGVFAFGDARFQGSMGGQKLDQPVVGMSFDASTSGYWLVARDGGVFAFDSPFFGSTGGRRLNAPVVGLSSNENDSGYYLVASDGGVFSFGSTPFLGSMGGKRLNAAVVGSAAIG
jgi:hypothetical protein